MPFRSCKKVMADLDLIVDGEATAALRLRFMMHIAMCNPCARYYRQYLAVHEAAAQLNPDSAPGELDEPLQRILDRLNSEPPSR